MRQEKLIGDECALILSRNGGIRTNVAVKNLDSAIEEKLIDLEDPLYPLLMCTMLLTSKDERAEQARELIGSIIDGLPEELH